MGSADRYPSLPNGFRDAPVSRRFVAALIDLTVAIVPLGGTGFGGYKLCRFLGPRLRPLTRRLEAWGDAHDCDGRLEAWFDAHDFKSGTGKFSLRTRMLIEVVGLTLELDSRNRRSLGARDADPACGRAHWRAGNHSRRTDQALGTAGDQRRAPTARQAR
jgi:hypothetical protein